MLLAIPISPAEINQSVASNISNGTESRQLASQVITQPYSHTDAQILQGIWQYLLKVIATHFPVKPIPSHALKTSIREVLARIKILAGTLAVRAKKDIVSVRIICCMLLHKRKFISCAPEPDRLGGCLFEPTATRRC